MAAIPRGFRKAVVGIGILFVLGGCEKHEPQEDPLAKYRSFLSINQIKSSYYTEPKTGQKYPLVQGSRQIGHVSGLPFRDPVSEASEPRVPFR